MAKNPVERRARVGPPSNKAKKIAGACLLGCFFISMWLPLTLHHYLIDRMLEVSEVVELELSLFTLKRGTSPKYSYYGYKFEINGVEYRGDQIFSDEALIVNHVTGEVRSRVVYARHNPVYSRMEPVLVAGGVRWVSIFPKLWFAACALAFIAWLLASWEHLLKLIVHEPAGGSLRRQNFLTVILNAFTAVTVLLVPAFIFGAFLAYNDRYSLFREYSPLALSIVGILLVLLPVNVWLGNRLEKSRGLQ